VVIERCIKHRRGRTALKERHWYIQALVINRTAQCAACSTVIIVIQDNVTQVQCYI
jgi:hypothetical protein